MIDAGVAARSEWPRFVFTLSNGSLPSTLRAFKNRAIGFSEVVPNPESLSNPLVRQLALDAEKHGGGFLALSYPGMEGYLGAKLFADAPKQLPRGASARALAAVLARPDGWNLSGHLIGFSGGRVWGSRQVRLGVRTPGGGVTY